MEIDRVGSDFSNRSLKVQIKISAFFWRRKEKINWKSKLKPWKKTSYNRYQISTSWEGDSKTAPAETLGTLDAKNILHWRKLRKFWVVFKSYITGIVDVDIVYIFKYMFYMFPSMHITFYWGDFIISFNNLFFFVFNMNGKFWIIFDELNFDYHLFKDWYLRFEDLS